jgi:hypothetical protein
MEIISFTALLLLSLVGYSAGAVGKARKIAQLKPRLIDLIFILCIWSGAVYSRVTLDLNRWLLILAWLILSSILGILASWPRSLSKRVSSDAEQLKISSRNPLKKLWQGWKNFSMRMGSFQTRVIFSLFFFIIVSAFALAVKYFSDPLKIKRPNKKSHWLLKNEIRPRLEQFKRQF